MARWWQVNGTSRRPWVPLAVAVALTLVMALPSTAQSSSKPYELHIDCPERFGAGAADPNSIICPIKAIDEDDIMGSPSLAVDPNNPRNVILASLHGADGQGPTDRSRADGGGSQPFTTFVTFDHGAQWRDNPYNSPGALQGSFGEHPQVKIDKFGHVYIGSLYALPSDAAPSGYEYTVVAQKFDDIEQTAARQQGTWGAQYLDAYFFGNVIPEFWFVPDNDTGIMTIMWNEIMPAQEEQAASQAGVLDATGLASTQEDAPGDFGRSVIGMAWTTPGGSKGWTYVDDDLLVGPCDETSNPVIADGQIYIACRVNVKEGGYAWDEDPVEGQVDLFRMDLTTGAPEYMGTSPVNNGGMPRLAVREDGRLALLSAGVGADGNTKVTVAFGWAAKDLAVMHWGDKVELGDRISRPTEGAVVTEVRVQDAVIREDSGTVIFILKEQYQSLGIVPDDPESLLKPRYLKQVVAINEKAREPLRIMNLDVGNPANRTPFPTKIDLFETDQEAVFNDLTDDIILFPKGQSLPPGWEDRIPTEKHEDYQRMFIAYGDYGIIHFAELVEITDQQVGAAGVPAAAVANPAPALGVATIAMMVAGTALAGLLALKMALNRSSSESVAITKGGK
jgi:hypothetical protein